ncbi:hypothetical protein EC845_1217 [Comamonas sp. BIGb0124]|uniref:dual OB domain-containing protein n=1 Tax=Comamonas sp. BIGb0124 TaxID=2485130 RepID=UPI000FAFE1C6|nr:hypothetical protein [Comamonas sp. BIGb0124]ROR25177.1 hypothetical protein EC845_1217 [Comamonas sp. BIGb0124]
MIKKTILLLAISRKHKERCLAGREYLDGRWGDWIRPVSAREGQGLNFQDTLIKEPESELISEPLVLDVVEVPLIRPNPQACQTENWLISSSNWWERLGSLNWEKAAALAENPDALWVNGFHTQLGLNDEVPVRFDDVITSSLCLVRVAEVTVQVVMHYSKKKVRANFSHNGVGYNLSLTDSYWENYYLQLDTGFYDLGECLLTISLTEPFRKNEQLECRYKLVAAMILAE